MVEQSLAERIRAYAAILTRGSGSVPAGDVAWKLHQILGDQAPDAPVVSSTRVKLRGPWVWLPNANVTRLHAVRRRAAGDHYTPTACDSWGLVLADTAVSGDMPPKCKRCVRAVGEA